LKFVVKRVTRQTMMIDTDTLWTKSHIKSQLAPLQESTLGISWHNISLTPSTSKLSPTSNYYLKVSIPYVKQTLVWEISFNPLCPELGPEIIIDGEEFAEIGNYQCLMNNLNNFIQWKTTDHLALKNVLNEFLDFYKQKQIKLLKEKSEKLHSEYMLLQDELGSKNIEILVVNGLKQVEVKFLLKLCIDSPNDSIFQTTFLNRDLLLYINFNGPSFNRISPELYLSPYLKTFFNNIESLHIPQFAERQHVIEYVNGLKTIIIQKINHLQQSLELRKKFITSLIVLRHNSVLECDIITFKRISLLYEHPDLHFVLNFTLPLNFPKEQFVLTMNSIYQMTDQGKPLCRVIKNFPYSPRWEPKKMILKVLEHVINKEIKIFQDIH